MPIRHWFSGRYEYIELTFKPDWTISYHSKWTLGITVLVRPYLRASTDEQDASRARSALETFVRERRLTVAAWYMENDSGARLLRPELFRLLRDAGRGDVLLIEQVDRLSRLTRPDWERLKEEIIGKGVRVVALDLPTSWAMATSDRDDFTTRMLDAINGMLLDVLAAVARKDYDDRRRRQAEGQARAKAAGVYKGRREDVRRNTGILEMLKRGMSWSAVQNATGCSRATVAKVAKRRTDPEQVRPVDESSHRALAQG